MFMRTVALAVALAGAAAFTPPPLFGPPRTRAAALAYAKKAVYKKADKDQQPETTQVHQVQPHKGPRHSRWSGRVEMSIDPSCVPGTPILRNQKIMRLTLSLTGRHAAGSVVVPDYVLPLAAATCYSIPVMILFLSGDMDKDRFKRSHTGLTLKQRAVEDFQRGLTRALQRVGVLAEPRPTTARSELGCDPHPPPRRARDLHPRPSLTSALLGRRLRSNQAVITMRAADKGEEERAWACIMFEGMEVCGPSRFEDGSTCVFNGQRWVCA